MLSELLQTADWKSEKPGTLLAMAYCNIHGLWQNSMELEVQ